VVVISCLLVNHTLVIRAHGRMHMGFPPNYVESNRQQVACRLIHSFTARDTALRSASTSLGDDKKMRTTVGSLCT
jgi:hypothetical protein